MKKLTFKVLKKNSETGLIFFLLGGTYTIAWAIVGGAGMILVLLGLISLIRSLGDAIVPPDQDIIIAVREALKIIFLAPCAGFLMAFFSWILTKKSMNLFGTSKGVYLFIECNVLL
ncbi:hypothetical protein [Vampirovibrio sp.]|uniref:hypothetical protein n=1 Tax=Vampirovibrio sp. TaxID=2717857 RepID=UPI00359312ED